MSDKAKENEKPPRSELGDVGDVETDFNQTFVDEAPDLPFKLPFGLGKLFHRQLKRWQNRKQRKSFRAP